MQNIKDFKIKVYILFRDIPDGFGTIYNVSLDKKIRNRNEKIDRTNRLSRRIRNTGIGCIVFQKEKDILSQYWNHSVIVLTSTNLRFEGILKDFDDNFFLVGETFIQRGPGISMRFSTLSPSPISQPQLLYND